MTGIIIGVVVVAVLVILASGYVKASPDKAFIISGLRKNPMILIGKAGIKIPFLEKKDELNLKLTPIDVKTSSAVPTADYINIFVDAVVNVKISTDRELMKKASQNFLNKQTDYIAAIAREVLEGNMREIVGTMKLQDMVSDRQTFAEKVKENAVPDLNSMGLEIVSFNVQNFTDSDHVIENLGVDNIVRIRKGAAISRAESEKEIVIAQARAKKEANDVEVTAEQEIAVKQNELLIKQAELKQAADIKKAESDAAYTIQQEEQRKTIEATKADANIIAQMKEIELKKKEAEVKEQALDAEVKKQADADKYAEQQNADAQLYKRQRTAEAEKYETEQQAEAEKLKAAKEAEALKLKAEAQKFAKVQEAEAVKAQGLAEAEAIRAKAMAEAEGIRAKALAEAEGIDKKADAMKKYGEAAVLQMYFDALPEVVRNAAEPLSKIDSMNIYGSGDTSQLVGNVMNTVTQVNEGMKQSVGFDLQSIIGGMLGSKLAENKKANE